MPAVFYFRYTVGPGEIDGQNHVNNIEYVRWMQSAAVGHSTAQGWPGTRYREIGAGWVVRRHSIDYLQPAFLGDEIVVQTWVSEFKRISSRRKYRIVRPRDETVLATAETDWAFISRTGHVPRRIPPELAAAFVVVSTDDEPDAFPAGDEGRVNE